jgi:hypothetical protein
MIMFEQCNRGAMLNLYLALVEVGKFGKTYLRRIVRLRCQILTYVLTIILVKGSWQGFVQCLVTYNILASFLVVVKQIILLLVLFLQHLGTKSFQQNCFELHVIVGTKVD